MRKFRVLTKLDDKEVVLCPIGEISDGPVKIKERTKEQCLNCVWHSAINERTFRKELVVEVSCESPVCSFCGKEMGLCKTPEQTNQLEPVLRDDGASIHQSVGQSGGIDVYWWKCGADHCEKDFSWLLHELIGDVSKEVVAKGNEKLKGLEKELKEKFKERNKELTKSNNELKKELRKKYSSKYNERVEAIKEKYKLVIKKKVKPATSLMSFVES